MEAGDRGEILWPDGRCEPIERRTRHRHLLVYGRSAGKSAGQESVDRRARQRPVDLILRGRVVDLLR
ncbi:hypothetical protein [Geminicoccus roseus]|uniref:hypothetical protein n=1 Tax=Geminicoccus roseus TaxID=404900 RepID=UPI0004123203|nr:hypothetical protein [Geminicoccus roseus]